MKKIMLTALAAVAMAGAASAASAQPYGGYDRGGYGYDRGYRVDRYDSRDLNARQSDLRKRVDWAVRSGRVSRGEGQYLRNEIRDINQLERRFRNHGGLDQRELRIMHQRLDRLEGRMQRFAWNGYR